MFSTAIDCRRAELCVMGIAAIGLRERRGQNRKHKV
jgi:hypothetical protein